MLNSNLKTTVTSPIKRRKNRIKFLDGFLKNASTLNQNEECHCIINESDFVSAFIDSEKVPLLVDNPTFQISFKPSKGIFWFKIFHFALTFILLFFTSTPSFGQTVITQWNFESLTNSHVSNPAPAAGSGVATIVGSMTTSGSTTVQGFGNCNSSSNGGTGTIGWQISIAAPGSTSESSGVQFMISTAGFCDMKFSFDHRLSNTSTRTRRIQYTTDGTNWINFNVNSTNYLSNCPNQGGIDDGRIDASNPVGNNAGDRWTGVTSIDFSTISNANNNPNFGIRIVAAHYSTTGQFRQTNSVGTIATAGTWRFDNVTLSGSCSTPTTLSFTTQPNNVFQNSPMTPSVQVAATCSNGTISTCYNGTVTLTINSPGCGYTPQTVTFVNGVATFSNIVFLRSPQTNLTFTATSTGLTSVTSNSFNVISPIGAPFNLPTVNLGPDLNFCNGNSQELSASVNNFQPDLSYNWSPVTGLSASNISNPLVSGFSAAQTYTLTVTDGHGCIASDQVVITPQFPPTIIFLSPP